MVYFTDDLMVRASFHVVFEQSGVIDCHRRWFHYVYFPTICAV